MSTWPTLSERIEHWRGLRGWSLRQLAGHAGVAPSTVLRVERGQDPSLSSLRAIADAFGVTTTTLLAGTKEGER